MFYKNGILHFDLLLIISPLLYTNEILTVKKKETSKSHKNNLLFLRKKFANFVFYNSDKHIYISTIFAHCRLPYKVQKKEKWDFKMSTPYFQCSLSVLLIYVWRKKYEFQFYLSPQQGKIPPMCNQIISNFRPSISHFFEKGNKKSFCVEWLQKTPIKMERMLN